MFVQHTVLCPEFLFSSDAGTATGPWVPLSSYSVFPRNSLVELASPAHHPKLLSGVGKAALIAMGVGFLYLQYQKYSLLPHGHGVMHKLVSSIVLAGEP